MGFNLALADTTIGHLVLAACVLIGLKLLAFVAQLWMQRGDYRTVPQTTTFRTIYAIGKTTPALASGFLCWASILMHRRAEAWFFGLFALFTAGLAVGVVRLRKQGRFFGLFEKLQRTRH